MMRMALVKRPSYEIEVIGTEHGWHGERTSYQYVVTYCSKFLERGDATSRRDAKRKAKAVIKQHKRTAIKRWVWKS